MTLCRTHTQLLHFQRMTACFYTLAHVLALPALHSRSSKTMEWEQLNRDLINWFSVVFLLFCFFRLGYLWRKEDLCILAAGLVVVTWTSYFLHTFTALRSKKGHSSDTPMWIIPWIFHHVVFFLFFLPEHFYTTKLKQFPYLNGINKIPHLWVLVAPKGGLLINTDEKINAYFVRWGKKEKKEKKEG